VCTKHIQAPETSFLYSQLSSMFPHLLGTYPLFHSATLLSLSLQILAMQLCCYPSCIRLFRSQSDRLAATSRRQHTYSSCTHCHQDRYVTIMLWSIAPSSSETGCQRVKIRLQFCLLRDVYLTIRSHTERKSLGEAIWAGGRRIFPG
jgi:hypothetical protein